MTNERLMTIIRELTHGASEIQTEELNGMIRAIMAAKRVFVAGMGRSGLISRAFAMRLMHLGLQAYAVGESTTPSIQEHDLLIILSGSGNTSSMVGMAQKAISMKAAVALITTNREGKLAFMTNTMIWIPGVSKETSGDQKQSVQMVGSMFEQLAWISCDAMVCTMMKESGQDSADLMKRHANLE